MQCADCKWLKSLEDSQGNTIMFCMNADSGAYLQKIEICGNCNEAQIMGFDPETPDDQRWAETVAAVLMGVGVSIGLVFLLTLIRVV